MTVWFVIYIGTAVGGAFPAPNAEACVNAAASQTILLQRQIATGHDLKGGPIDPVARLLRFGCVQADAQPVLTFNMGPSL